MSNWQPQRVVRAREEVLMMQLLIAAVICLVLFFSAVLGPTLGGADKVSVQDLRGACKYSAKGEVEK